MKKSFFLVARLDANAMKTPFRRFKLIIILFILTIVSSCKKELLVSPLAEKKKAIDKEIKIENVSYSRFLNSINLDATGNLKETFSKSVNTNKQIQASGNSILSGFILNTDSVKKLIVKDTVSYIFTIKPATPRAISFTNLTIQEKNGKTSAFLTTYTPTQKWIQDWRSKRITSSFEGQMKYKRLNLKGTPQSGSTKTDATKPVKVVQAIMVCEAVWEYYVYAYPCASSDRHMPWDNCEWQGQDGGPGYAIGSIPHIVCEAETGGGGDIGSGGGGGGGGSTSPTPPPTYNPCDGGQLVAAANGKKVDVAAQPTECDTPDPGSPQPIFFDPYEPITLPENFDISYTQDWFDAEDTFGLIEAEIVLQGISKTDPIPEMYYKNGTKVDMINAVPLNGRRTALGFPSNHRYFWKELTLNRPEMFSAFNRAEIIAGRRPIIDEQWIKYNPTHKSYMNDFLVHHHEGQGRYAFAIPQKVHQKWSRILHTIKTKGSIGGLRSKLTSLGSALQIFSLLTDLKTGNPDAWINWFGQQNEIGKIYKDNINNVYFELTQKTETKNSQGVVTHAIIVYNTYEDYVWDDDEKKYMGVIKLGTFTEYIDVINVKTLSRNFQGF